MQKRKKIAVIGHDERLNLELRTKFFCHHGLHGKEIGKHLEDMGYHIDTAQIRRTEELEKLLHCSELVIVNDSDPNNSARYLAQKAEEMGLPVVVITDTITDYFHKEDESYCGEGFHYLFERNSIEESMFSDTVKLLIETSQYKNFGYRVSFKSQEFPKALQKRINRNVKGALVKDMIIPTQFSWPYKDSIAVRLNSYVGLNVSDISLDIISNDFRSLAISALFAFMIKYPIADNASFVYSAKPGVPVITGSLGYKPEHVEIMLKDYNKKG